MPKDFVTISRKEGLLAYKELINSQERHFKSAATLASIQEYGHAISHLILGSEELVKALIVYFDGIGLSIRSVKGVKKFFRDHKTRHSFVTLFCMLSLTIKLLMKLIERYKELLHEPEKRDNMTEFEKVLMLTGKPRTEEIAEECVRVFGNKELNQVSNEIDFWRQADELKQKGFYVDFQDELVTSQTLTKTDYDMAYSATSLFCIDCKTLIENFENTGQEEKDWLVLSIKEDDFYYKMLEGFIDSQAVNFETLLSPFMESRASE